MDYSQAIKLDQENDQLTKMRGYSYFLSGKFEDATKDLHETVNKLPSNAYAALWLYLAKVRVGSREAAIELQANEMRLPRSQWPYSAVEMFLGRKSPDDIVREVSNVNDNCEAQFFIEEYHLLHDNRSKAISAMRSAGDCPKALVETHGAKVELMRMNAL